MKMRKEVSWNRRRWLRGVGLSGLAACASGRSFGEELLATPRLTEGPFYPDKLPLDTDNDLLILNGSTSPAIGEVTHLSGRVLTRAGSPLRGAVVEIWQVDGRGVYLHSADDRKRDQQDRNFQGYGRFLTDASGAYYFRTIKPVPYPGRTPHIHVAVSRNGERLLTTQILIKGHPQNAGDGVLRSVKEEKLRELLLAEFTPVKGSRIGELSCRFDLILGLTPEDGVEAIKGGIGQSEWAARGGGRKRNRQ